MWPDPQLSAYLATFTEEILNGEKLTGHIHTPSIFVKLVKSNYAIYA